MRPMLDDLELPLVQEMTTLERRVLAEHKPPQMSGSLLQNLGRRPTRLALWGVATGTDARSFVEKLDGKFRDGNPLPFAADIVADAKLEKVVIENLRIQDLAGKPERFAYLMTLREYIEPVEPEDTSLLDQDILNDALDVIDQIPLGLAFLDVLSPFIARLTDINDALRREGVGGLIKPN